MGCEMGCLLEIDFPVLAPVPVSVVEEGGLRDVSKEEDLGDKRLTVACVFDRQVKVLD